MFSANISNRREKSVKWWTQLFWQRPQKTDQLEEINFDGVTLAYEVDISKVPHDFLLVQIDKVVQDHYESWTTKYWDYLCTVHKHDHTETTKIWKEAVHLMHFTLNLKSTSFFAPRTVAF